MAERRASSEPSRTRILELPGHEIQISNVTGAHITTVHLQSSIHTLFLKVAECMDVEPYRLSFATNLHPGSVVKWNSSGSGTVSALLHFHRHGYLTNLTCVVRKPHDMLGETSESDGESVSSEDVIIRADG